MARKIPTPLAGWTAGVLLAFALTGGLYPPAANVNQVHGSTGNMMAQELSYRFQSSWQSLRTFRVANPSPVAVTVYTGLPADSPYHGYIVNSLSQWSGALDNRLQYVLVNNPRQAQIRFHWVSQFPDKTMGGETVSRIEDADIYIRTKGIPASDIHANIMHELGHALGINGHSPYSADVMTAFRQWKKTAYTPVLTVRDKQAIQRLYSASWSEGEDLYRISSQQR